MGTIVGGRWAWRARAGFARDLILGDGALLYILPICEANLFLIRCFTSYLVFSMAVLPHSPGVVYCHLLLRREPRIPWVAPFSFRIGIRDLFVPRGQKSYTPTAFRKL